MMNFGFARIVRIVCLLMLALSVTLAMSAQTTSTKKTTHKKSTTTAVHKKTAQVQATQADPGQRAFIDPATHKPYQPGQEELQALNATGKKQVKTTAKLKIKRLPNGVTGIMLPEENMAYSVATKSPKGKVSLACVDGKNKAEKLVKSGPVAQTSKEALDEK